MLHIKEKSGYEQIDSRATIINGLGIGVYKVLDKTTPPKDDFLPLAEKV